MNKSVQPLSNLKMALDRDLAILRMPDLYHIVVPSAVFRGAASFYLFAVFHEAVILTAHILGDRACLEEGWREYGDCQLAVAEVWLTLVEGN